MFTHIQAYNKHIQATEGSVQPWHISNPGIFRTIAYSEASYIQNSCLFKILVYSEPWRIQNLRHIQNSAKHLRWSVLRN